MTPALKSNITGRRRTTTAPLAPKQAADMRAAFTTQPAREVINTSFNLPVELHQHLKRLAFERDTSMKELIVEAVEAAYPLP